MALDSQLVFQLRVLHDVQFTGSSYRCRQGSSSSAMPRALPMYRLKRSERIRRKAPNGICQDTSKKLVRSLFIPEEPQQGLCPYASLPQDIFLT